MHEYEPKYGYREVNGGRCDYQTHEIPDYWWYPKTWLGKDWYKVKHPASYETCRCMEIQHVYSLRPVIADVSENK